MVCDGSDWYVECGDCTARGGIGEGELDALQEWNRRALEARIEEMEELVRNVLQINEENDLGFLAKRLDMWAIGAKQTLSATSSDKALVDRAAAGDSQQQPDDGAADGDRLRRVVYGRRAEGGRMNQKRRGYIIRWGEPFGDPHTYVSRDAEITLPDNVLASGRDDVGLWVRSKLATGWESWT